MKTKHTKEYAENLAKEVIQGKNIGNTKHMRMKFVNGYTKAIEVNKVPEVLKSLITLQKRLEFLILQTPSGEERNRMTDENMFAISLINELS